MNNKTPIVALLLMVISIYTIFSVQPNDPTSFISFDQFKREFNKTYSSPLEETYRKIIFNTNQNRIKLHNSGPNLSYKLGITQFADLTDDQFVKTYLGTVYETNSAKSQNTLVDDFVKPRKSKNLQDRENDVDWASRGKVTPVRNQGMCGSCWAFSSVGAVESSYSIFRGELTNLSEQQLVDCSSSYGNNGCNGGKMESALAYIKDHGLSTEKEYPYVGRQQGCRKDSGNYKISSFSSASECSNLYNALQQRPISAGVDASTWALYKQGILTICGRNINHGVLLVGAAQNYWKIKNSWGTSWGENGYIRIGRGNTCGVCETPFYPVL